MITKIFSMQAIGPAAKSLWSLKGIELFVFKVSAVAVLALAVVPTSSPAAFCDSLTVRDYEKPLRLLPAPEPVPETLPFGPAGLRASALRLEGNQLSYPGGAARFQLENLSDSNLKLDWTIQVSVSRPNANGQPLPPVSQTATTAGSLMQGALFAIEGPPMWELGSYRIDIAFLDSAGNTLGSYFEFVKVVPIKLQARLRLARSVVSPGGVLRARLENLGTATVGYGEAYLLHRYHKGRWERVPQQEKFLAVMRILGAGQARCQGIRIFRSVKPGLYRIQKNVRFLVSRERRERTLIRKFKVETPHP